MRTDGERGRHGKRDGGRAEQGGQGGWGLVVVGGLQAAVSFNSFKGNVELYRNTQWQQSANANKAPHYGVNCLLLCRRDLPPKPMGWDIFFKGPVSV